VPRRELLKNTRRIVVKIGTSLVTDDGAIAPAKVSRLVKDIAAVIAGGRQVVVVSSGAIGAGCGALGRPRKSLSIPEKQAIAAVGQIVLINEWRKCFQREGYQVGQILLTEDDVKHRRRFLNARHTMHTLLEMGIVPVVNENDSVVVKEIKFGDNDTLSAHVTNIVQADLLVLLSDIDGFYRDLADPEPVEEIYKIDDDVIRMAGGAGSEQGTGGMATKIRAADIVIKSGEKMIIADGGVPGILPRILNGEKVGTIFVGKGGGLASKKRWIAFNMPARGSITVDDGAVRAIRERKKSLLATGITAIDGKFDLGDAVEVMDAGGGRVGKGVVNYTRDELARIVGKKTDEIRKILGGTYYDEVINRDELIIF